MQVKVEMDSGATYEGTLIAKAWSVAILKLLSGKFILISKYHCKNPDVLNFKEDENER